MKYHFTRRSRNRKTGPMPTVMTEPKSCPTACPLKNAGCYADAFPMSLHWHKIADTGISLATLCDHISALPANQIWRMNTAGDLAGNAKGFIAPRAVKNIVAANKGKRGFTYTHHDTGREENRDVVKYANTNGFTVNLSANNLRHADRLKALDVGPVVSILGTKARENMFTPDGHRVVICPAVTGKSESCDTCKLCAIADREVIIGFPAHGNRKRKADAIASA